MGSRYSDNHIAGDLIHTNIATCNIEEPQQNYHLGKVSNILLGDLIMFSISKPTPFASALVRIIWSK